MTKEVRTVCKMMENAYIKVYGAEKWNSLTAKEQHDVIMILVKDTTKALDIIEAI